MTDWPTIYRCRRCGGPLHCTLWDVGEHQPWHGSRCPPRRAPPEPEPEPEPPEPVDLPPLAADRPLHWPVAEIDEVRTRNRWE